jgi:hypothetical protein
VVAVVAVGTTELCAGVEIGLAVEDELGVEGGLDGALEVVVDEPDDPAGALPLCPCDAASGSTYWLSPADGPAASATAGARQTSAITMSNPVVVTRHQRTRRVWQDGEGLCSPPAKSSFAGSIASTGAPDANATGRVRVLAA